MALINQAFDTLDAYVAFFGNEPIPVLKHTVKELQTMREQEESINGRTVAALVLSDPMMTLKV
ncbi:MAG TPA: histidine kinase, partial [Zoogloea sp.]|nr:histidine kinase [Zoogloea sp.]